MLPLSSSAHLVVGTEGIMVNFHPVGEFKVSLESAMMTVRKAKYIDMFLGGQEVEHIASILDLGEYS